MCAQSDRQRYQDQVLVLTNLCQEEKKKSEKIQLELDKLKSSTSSKKQTSRNSKKASVLDNNVDFYKSQMEFWQEKFATELSRSDILDKQIQQEKTDASVKIESLELHLKQAKLEVCNLTNQLKTKAPSPAATPLYSPISTTRNPGLGSPPISPLKQITKTPIISPIQKPTISPLPPPTVGLLKATAYKTAAPKPQASPTHEVINLIWDTWEDEIDNYVMKEKENDKDEEFLPTVNKRKKKTYVID